METMWEETEWLHFLELCRQVMEDWPVREGKCYLSVIVLLAREIDISDYRLILINCIDQAVGLLLTVRCLDLDSDFCLSQFY